MLTTQRVLLFVLAALLVAIGAVLASGHGAPRPSDSGVAAVAVHPSGFDGPTMPPRLRAASFSLLDQNGHRVTLAQYRGHVVVLSFMHSLCHGACPLMAEQIKGALNDLPDRGGNVPAIAISVDPAQDSRAHRRRFLAKYGMTGRLAFLSGPRGTLTRIWHAYAIQPQAGRSDTHSAFVLLIDKRGFERVGFPVSSLTPEGLSHDLAVLERERT